MPRSVKVKSDEDIDKKTTILESQMFAKEVHQDKAERADDLTPRSAGKGDIKGEFFALSQPKTLQLSLVSFNLTKKLSVS